MGTLAGDQSSAYLIPSCLDPSTNQAFICIMIFFSLSLVIELDTRVCHHYTQELAACRVLNKRLNLHSTHEKARNCESNHLLKFGELVLLYVWYIWGSSFIRFNVLHNPFQFCSPSILFTSLSDPAGIQWQTRKAKGIKDTLSGIKSWPIPAVVLWLAECFSLAGDIQKEKRQQSLRVKPVALLNVLCIHETRTLTIWW